MFLEVATDNISAQKLYQAFGFDEVGRRDGYYQRANGTRISAYTMRCDLTRLPTAEARSHPGADRTRRLAALSRNTLVCTLVNGQTSAEITKLYSALLMGFLAHLTDNSKKMLAPVKTRNMFRSHN